MKVRANVKSGDVMPISVQLGEQSPISGECECINVGCVHLQKAAGEALR